MASGAGVEGTFKETLVNELVLLLKDFIWRWIQRHGFGNADMIREELDVTELHEPRQQRVSQAFQDIGDEVDSKGDLLKLMDNPSTLSIDFFKKVVDLMFSDGKITWSKVVSVFYFTCLLVMKAHQKNVCDMIRTIIQWAIEFFQEKLINWIKQHGGWDGVLSNVGTPTWQAAAIFLAGVLTTILVIRCV